MYRVTVPPLFFPQLQISSHRKLISSRLRHDTKTGNVGSEIARVRYTVGDASDGNRIRPGGREAIQFGGEVGENTLCPIVTVKLRESNIHLSRGEILVPLTLRPGTESSQHYPH